MQPRARRTRVSWRRIVAAGVLGVLGSACSPGADAMPRAAPTPAISPSCRPIDVGVFQTVMYDYQPVASLEQLLAQYDGTVVVGRVGGYTESLRRHVVMRVEVDRVLREGEEPVVRDGAAYLAFWRGAQVGDTGRQVLEAGDFAEAVPSGTRLLAVVSAAPPRRQRLTRLPEGGVLGQSGIQGLFLDGCGALVGARDHLMPSGPEFGSYDALVVAVERLIRGSRGGP